MTIFDAVGDEDDDLRVDLPGDPHGEVRVAASGAAPALSPVQALPVLPIDYERAVQPPEARIVWESHLDGETFTDPFSAWRTLLALAQWGLLLLASVVHFVVFHVRARQDVTV